MKALFQNKKQKTVWIICVVCIFFSLENLNGNTTDATLGFLTFLMDIIAVCVMSLILTALMRNKE